MLHKSPRVSFCCNVYTPSVYDARYLYHIDFLFHINWFNSYLLHPIPGNCHAKLYYYIFANSYSYSYWGINEMQRNFYGAFECRLGNESCVWFFLFCKCLNLIMLIAFVCMLGYKKNLELLFFYEQHENEEMCWVELTARCVNIFRNFHTISIPCLMLLNKQKKSHA